MYVYVHTHRLYSLRKLMAVNGIRANYSNSAVAMGKYYSLDCIQIPTGEDDGMLRFFFFFFYFYFFFIIIIIKNH